MGKSAVALNCAIRAVASERRSLRHLVLGIFSTRQLLIMAPDQGLLYRWVIQRTTGVSTQPRPGAD